MKLFRMTPEAHKAYQAKRAAECAAIDNVEFVDIGVGTMRLPQGQHVNTKFGNVPTDGYHSKREAKRAAELKLLVRTGRIRNLREQVKYLLIPKQEGERECSYIADFVYDEYLPPVPPITGNTPWRWGPVVEDCKGHRTPDYIIKRKLMLFVHQVKVRET